ncbi:MAG: preprotein translocase subunit YajC [Sporichthyaceae bacterium]|nr:preprotein translocase subunit YajC [Sporichthyaceae bacterium]
METVSAVFPFALILVAFYFLIIRPSRARQRATLELQQQLAPGLEVLTASGIYGRVSSVEDDVVTLEVAPGTSVRFAKGAVARVVSQDSAVPLSEDDLADPPPSAKRPDSGNSDQTSR